jgi:hypothetical protein
VLLQILIPFFSSILLFISNPPSWYLCSSNFFNLAIHLQ